MKLKLITLFMILVLALAACSPGQDPGSLPDTGMETPGVDETPMTTETPGAGDGTAPATADPVETEDVPSPATPDARTPGIGTPQANGIEGYNDLVNNLIAFGMTVETTGEIEQPFFEVNGRTLRLDGADIQVFEFADEATRMTASDTISADGAIIGTTIPSWVDQPNFWATGRLIVLYVGQDENIINRLNTLLGEPLTESTGSTGAGGGASPPRAVEEAQRLLSEDLGVSLDQIQVISVAQVEWTDGCLELAGPGENCTQVITPGYLITLRVNGQDYEVRTDTTGSTVRWSGT